MYPVVVRASTSAPRSSSVRTTSVWPSHAAHISAVCPFAASLAFTSAPRSSNEVTVSNTPPRAQVISTVSPVAWAPCGSAPASSNRVTIPGLAFVQASTSGVTP